MIRSETMSSPTVPYYRPRLFIFGLCPDYDRRAFLLRTRSHLLPVFSGCALLAFIADFLGSRKALELWHAIARTDAALAEQYCVPRLFHDQLGASRQQIGIGRIRNDSYGL